MLTMSECFLINFSALIHVMVFGLLAVPQIDPMQKTPCGHLQLVFAQLAFGQRW